MPMADSLFSQPFVQTASRASRERSRRHVNASVGAAHIAVPTVSATRTKDGQRGRCAVILLIGVCEGGKSVRLLTETGYFDGRFIFSLIKDGGRCPVIKSVAHARLPWWRGKRDRGSSTKKCSIAFSSDYECSVQPMRKQDRCRWRVPRVSGFGPQHFSGRPTHAGGSRRVDGAGVVGRLFVAAGGLKSRQRRFLVRMISTIRAFPSLRVKDGKISLGRMVG
jgi:hypothetical protein